MTQIVHRHTFTIAEAVAALLPDIGDCEEWQIRVDGDAVVVDVVEPADASRSEEDETAGDNDENTPENNEVDPDPEVSSEQLTDPDPDPDPEPELKGGRLARQAAICCGERGFWTFLGVTNADEAKADVCRRCGIESRKELDAEGNADAAAAWENIHTKYQLWLGGHDVELD